jgi:taurine dioxygenase
VASFKVSVMEPFGVQVVADLSVPLDVEAQAELRALVRTHHLLLARDNDLSFDDQVRVMGHLGRICRSEDGPPGPRDFVSKDDAFGKNLGTSAFAWHSDMACCKHPLQALSLHAVDVSEGQTSTRFADGARALASLSPATRARIDELAAMHCWQPKHDTPYRAFGTPATRIPTDRPRYSHPVVLTHPDSGELVLYVAEMMTDHIEGLSVEASDELLEELFSVLYDSSNVYEHWWRNGDLVIWDNVAVQHSRSDVGSVARRTMRRVVTGEMTMFEQNPQLAYSDGKVGVAEH